jgi:CheY-like chemotaxis protein
VTPARSTILLVEDREDDVFFLRRALAHVGADVDIRVVGNGAEAQSYIVGEEAFANRAYYPMPDLIVCDFKMPRRSGVDFLRWLRGQKEFEHLPFILLSGSVLPHEEDVALQLGANLYLRKTPNFTKMTEHAQTILQLMREMQASPKRQAQDHVSRQRLILVIDDEAKVRKMMGDVLQAFGFGVLAASTSEEGLICARARRPDVILCDVVLPDASGFETARTLNEDPLTIGVPVVLMTGYPYMSQYVAQSKWKLLVKPITANSVVETVACALQSVS